MKLQRRCNVCFGERRIVALQVSERESNSANAIEPAAGQPAALESSAQQFAGELL